MHASVYAFRVGPDEWCLTDSSSGGMARAWFNKRGEIRFPNRRQRARFTTDEAVHAGYNFALRTARERLHELGIPGQPTVHAGAYPQEALTS